MFSKKRMCKHSQRATYTPPIFLLLLISHWRKLKGHELIGKVAQGVKFKDGEEVKEAAKFLNRGCAYTTWTQYLTISPKASNGILTRLCQVCHILGSAPSRLLITTWLFISFSP
jgi:hypothetical protein